VSDGQGLPLAVAISPGQSHESKHFEETMNAVRIPRPQGRPRTRPKRVAADKAYSNRRIRTWCWDHRIAAVIPRKSNETGRHGAKRPFDRETYRRRNVVERCIALLRECRRIATRFEKLARSYLAMLKLAMIDRYFRMNFSNTA